MVNMVCQVTRESYDAWLRCGPDKVQSYETVLILSLTSKHDLDISGTALIPVCDTLPYHGERLCQVSLKSYDAWLRCGPDESDRQTNV